MYSALLFDKPPRGVMKAGHGSGRLSEINVILRRGAPKKLVVYGKFNLKVKTSTLA
jgi:hypothetical protein